MLTLLLSGRNSEPIRVLNPNQDKLCIEISLSVLISNAFSPYILATFMVLPKLYDIR